MKEKFYAVKNELERKIFSSWDECSAYIKGNKKVQYKAFLTIEEANDFLEDKQFQLDHSIPTAYIDGSFDVKTGCYSFGGVLIAEDKEYTFSKKYLPDEFSSARNVAGEIKGAGYIIQYCVNRGYQELVIVYDYVGIEKWFNGEWKANSLIAQNYVQFVSVIKNRIKIYFVKVKSHSNHSYNDKADTLAKQALGL